MGGKNKIKETEIRTMWKSSVLGPWKSIIIIVSIDEGLQLAS